MQIEVGELFRSSLAKIFPEPRREAMLHAIRLHVRLNGERIGVVIGERGERQFRVARFYVSRHIGYVRVFYEVAPERIALWHISRGSND